MKVQRLHKIWMCCAADYYYEEPLNLETGVLGRRCKLTYCKQWFRYVRSECHLTALVGTKSWHSKYVKGSNASFPGGIAEGLVAELAIELTDDAEADMQYLLPSILSSLQSLVQSD